MLLCPGGGIIFEDWAKTATSLQSECGSDPNCRVRVTSNPGATRCTNQTECDWVSDLFASCLYLANTWNSSYECQYLASHPSMWAQLVNCTSCNNPGTAPWALENLPFCNNGESSVTIDLKPESEYACFASTYMCIIIYFPKQLSHQIWRGVSSL